MHSMLVRVARVLPARHRYGASCALALCLSALCAQPLGAQSARYAASDQTTSIALEGPDSRREEPMFTFAYSVSTGVGDLHDYIRDPSFVGFDSTALWPVFRSLFLGVSFGYNRFYEAGPRSTYQLDAGAVTAKVYRYADAWPIACVVRYLFLERSSVLRPYIGLRTGVAWVDTSTLVVDRTITNTNTATGWLLAPEAGIDVYLTRSLLAHLSYQFNFTTASSAGFSTLSYNTFQAGFAVQL